MNSLVRGQKLPIFSESGLPHNQVAAQIARQATIPGQETDFAIVFGAMGIKNEEADYFRTEFEKTGALSKSVMILKVKKPDFLGESMWEFKYENRTIEAKFSDVAWLQKFRERAVILRPGDAIKALVETEVKYSFEGDVMFTTHKILAVHEIISVEGFPQNGLFEG